MEVDQKTLRHLVDVVWQYIWEDESVPSTATADKLIKKALENKRENPS